MSNSVLSGHCRLILSQAACYPSLAALRVGRIRTFSAASSDEPYTHVSLTVSGPRTVWPDESMGPFGPQDQRFQLPGNVGFDCHLDGIAGQKKTLVHKTVPDVLTAPSSTERQQFILAQFVNEFHGNLDPLSTTVHKAEQYFNQAGADCSINSCPELLRRDLELLFPTAPTNPITVVTVTHRSSQCGEAAEHDRDQLLQRFVNGAKEMCFSLWTAGYWADFIDPTTGAAFFASASSQTTLQTEEGCDIWASTSKRLGHALLSDISLEEHRCLWGQFSLTHLLTVLLLQDYKEFQMDLTMKSSVIL